MATALIQERRTVSGNQFAMRRIIEKAGQTFLAGTPLQIDTGTGGVQACATINSAATAIIAGIAKEFGANLTTLGVPLGTGVSTPTGPGGALFVGGGQVFGTVQNESAAQNFSRPYFNDGMTGFVVANQDTVFYGQVGPAQTTAITDKGKIYGMTKDTDNHWYVDKTITTTAGGACVTVIDLDMYDTTRGVLFVFLPAACQLLA
jgi:hypothetical protein